jgi:hypothetical protein
MDGRAGILIKDRGDGILNSHPCQERKGGATTESEREKKKDGPARWVSTDVMTFTTVQVAKWNALRCYGRQTNPLVIPRSESNEESAVFLGH